MKGQEIIDEFEDGIKAVSPDTINKIQVLAASAQMKMFDVHARAVGCLCECLGMNAENAMAVCANSVPPYNAGHYDDTMQKWELLNEKGEPTI